LIRFYKEVLPLDKLAAWNTFCDEHLTSIAKKVKDSRGAHKVVFLGNWTPTGGKFFDKVFATPQTKKQLGQTAIQFFKPIWSIVSALLKRDFPSMASVYEQIAPNNRQFDLLSLLIVNLTPAPKYHKDFKD